MDKVVMVFVALSAHVQTQAAESPVYVHVLNAFNIYAEEKLR